MGDAVVAIVLRDPAVSREPAAADLERLAETGVRVRRFDPAMLGRELDRADVAVDAIFGTGFRGEPEDDWAEAIDGLNRRRSRRRRRHPERCRRDEHRRSRASRSGPT